MTRSQTKTRRSRASLGSFVPVKEVCLQLQDNSTVRYSAAEFFGIESRDPNSQAARMAGQFAEQNRGLLRILDAWAETEYDGREVQLVVHSGRAVGAIPLVSPTTARRTTDS